MKRPLAAAGLSVFFACLAASCFADVRGVLVLCFAAFVVLVVSLFVQKSRRAAVLPTVCLSVLAGCLLFLSAQRFAVLPAERFVSKTCEVTAVVKSDPVLSQNKRRCYVNAKLCDESGKAIPGLVRVSLSANEVIGEAYATDLLPGDRLQFRGRFYQPGGEKRSVIRSFQGRGIYFGVYPLGKTQMLKGRQTGIYTGLLNLRKRALERLERAFPGDPGGVLAAILFGEKSLLSDAAYQSFRDAGVSHILAVSGLHLSVWVLFLFSFFRRRRGARKAALALMGLTVLVMAMALFSGSVLRAGVMMLVYLFGYALHRRADGLTSLGFAALVLLAVRPLLICNVGFVLSVLATLAILTLALPLSKQCSESLHRGGVPEGANRVLEPVMTAILISVRTAAATAPVAAAHFGSVSLVGAISNLLFLPLTLPLLLSGGAFLLLSGVPLLGGAFHAIAAGLSSLALKGASLCASIPHAVLYVQKTQAVFVFLGAASVCGLLLLLRIKKRFALRPVVAALLVLALSCSFCIPAFQTKNRMVLRAEAVQSGSCVLLQKGRRAVLLACECDDYDALLLADAWRDMGLVFEAAVLTDPEQANAALLKEIGAQTIYCADLSLLPGALRDRCSEQTVVSFADAALELRQNTILIRAFGQTMELSDEKTLALLQNSAIIHTDDTEDALSTANGTLVLTLEKGGKYWLRGEDSWRILMKSNSNST